MSWRRRGVYVWRCDKPYALFGLPIIGRHFAYVGQSNSFARRDREHLYGSSAYDAVVLPKPWSDLRPKRYAVPVLFPGWRWARERQEWLMIKLLLPAYNVQHNRTNPRRISPERARIQRAMREKNKTARNAMAAIRAVLSFCVLLAVALLIMEMAR